MLPLELSMTAFGPFPKQQTIDFTALGNNPLFLINGPTGAGKTTILDAICYVLYGETTGNERDGRDMRCDYAEAEQLTEIELTFELASRRYRIYRKPEQLRPKSRGEGFTSEKAEARIWRIGKDQDELLASQKIADVNREVNQLTGLSAQQFRQVMVLPQGKFRELLLAPSEEREKIFRQLFQTHVYSRLQDKLRDQAKQLSDTVETHKHKIDALLGSLKMESIEQLQQTVSLEKETLTAKQAEQLAADKQWDIAQIALNEAMLLDKSFQDLNLARQQWQNIEARQEEIHTLQIKLQRGQQAQSIENVYLELKRQQDGQNEIRRQLIIQTDKLDDAIQQKETASNNFKQINQQAESLDKLKQHLHQLRSFQQQHEAILQTEANFRQLNSELEGLQLQLQQGLQFSQQLTKQRQQKETQRLTILEAIEPLAQALLHMEKLQQKRSALNKYHELQKQQENIQKQFLKANEKLQTHEQQLQQQQRQFKLYQQLWHNGQAAILAEQLKDGIPCPVCGSKQHPHPADSQESIPSEQELNQLELTITQSMAEREKVKAVVEKLSAELGHNKQSLGELNDEYTFNAENTDIGELQQQLKNLQGQIDEMEKQRGLLPDAEQINELIQREEQSLLKSQELQQAVNEKQTHYSVTQNQLSSYRSELPEQYGDSERVNADLANTQSQIENLEQQLKVITEQYQRAEKDHSAVKAEFALLQNQYEKIEQELKHTQKVWDDKLQASPFSKQQEFLNSRIVVSEINALMEEINTYQERRNAAHKALADQQQLLDGQNPPDLEQLKQQEQSCRTAKEQAAKNYHLSFNQLKHYQGHWDSILEFEKKRKQGESEYQLIGYLAQISNGKNVHNLSLQRFVLSVLLDDVLIEAGLRLSQMSKGRYRLVRKEDVGDRRTKSGLELEVEDAYTGKLRPVATLSGGESFMAALSLALGLSDVVQAYAGGIRLDTLFVDEGFGSLDPESLDLAINTLIDLQRSGRMVGIISHVPELKERIDIRLDLSMDKEGSRVAIVLP